MEKIGWTVFSYLRAAAARIIKLHFPMLAAGCWLLTSLAFAAQDDTIVVTASRLDTPVKNTASSVSVIGQQDIKESGQTSVVEVLKGVPGIQVVESGGPAGDASIFIRGAASYHTLVLIDGIPAYDPMSTTRAFDFAHIDAVNIDRVEIVRGPQSTLYGSDAIGGVVNIITKKGAGKPEHSVEAGYGSRKTSRFSAQSSGSEGILNYSAGLSHLESQGFSAASEDMGNDEDDGYRNTTFSLRAGAKVAKDEEAEIFLRHIDSQNDLDNYGGAFGDDPNYKTYKEQFFSRLQYKMSLMEGVWEPVFGLNYSDIRRDERNPSDSWHPSDSSKSWFDSGIVKLDMQNTFYIDESNTVTAGAEYQEESARSYMNSLSQFGLYESAFSRKKSETLGFFAQEMFIKEGFSGSVGARVDDHDMFGTETTYRAAPSYIFDSTKTKIKGSAGTGFKAPSLYQLYSSYGDTALDPEKSMGWDAGVEQQIIEGMLRVDALYFRNEFDDLIDFDTASYKYININKAHSDGIEAGVDYTPLGALSIRLNYTLTRTEDESTGEDLLRRPRHKISCGVSWKPVKRLTLGSGVIYSSGSCDMDFGVFPAQRVELDAYTVVNASAEYEMNGRWSMFGRIDNLFNEEYESVRGYSTEGLGFFGGVRARF